MSEFNLSALVEASRVVGMTEEEVQSNAKVAFVPPPGAAMDPSGMPVAGASPEMMPGMDPAGGGAPAVDPAMLEAILGGGGAGSAIGGGGGDGNLGQSQITMTFAELIQLVKELAGKGNSGGKKLEERLGKLESTLQMTGLIPPEMTPPEGFSSIASGSPEGGQGGGLPPLPPITGGPAKSAYRHQIPKVRTHGDILDRLREAL